MPFEILSPSGDDARRWSELVEALPPQLRDIHFLPEYGRIYRDTYGYDVLLAVFRDGGDAVIQPFVRRPLAQLPFLGAAADAELFSDIANPYGYGGPLSTALSLARRRELYRGLAEGLGAWCGQRHVASEFSSLHPLMTNHQIPMIEGLRGPELEKEIVFIPLHGSEDDLRSRLNRGHKSSIAKARRAGVSVERVEPTAAHLRVFKELYYETMQRRDAAERWFFPEAFFSNSVEALGTARVSLFFAWIGREVESAYFLIHDFGTAYYHFAGSRDLRPDLRANNLLMYETAEWARKAGFAAYHLGGGVSRTADDSLFRFKAGFSRSRALLYTYFCIQDRNAYEELCARKRQFERATTGAEMSSGFLPLYRR
jgi:serine/alanine adding enzyme